MHEAKFMLSRSDGGFSLFRDCIPFALQGYDFSLIPSLAVSSLAIQNTCKEG